MHHALIDGIRRKFAKSIDKDPWDIEQEFGPDTEVEEVESPELPTASAIVLHAPVAPSGTNSVNSGEYCKSIVRVAILNGGKYGEHQIPIPWLRMILAGLEWERIDSEMMWYGFEATGPGGEILPEIPSYNDLFPSEPDVPAGTDPN